MDFGNPITDGTQVGSAGTYGFVVAFDLTLQEPIDINEVQLQDSSTGVYSDPETEETERAALFALMEDDQTDLDFAWCKEGNILYVYFRTAVYTFVATVRIAVTYTRNAINVDELTDKIDVRQDKENLFDMLVLRNMYVAKGDRVPQDIENKIAAERARLGI
jgi:hypothetical protein